MSFTVVRQKMLDETKGDWLLILDGDEVWWRDSVKKIVETIQREGKDLDSLVMPYYNIIGDIYHFQEEEAGQYKIDDRKGHINTRVVNRNIQGLHFDKPYGQESLFDKNNTLIQERSPNKRKFLDSPYMHFTNMVRSSSSKQDQTVLKRGFKYKYELGKAFPKNFKYPEVFYMDFPKFIPSPWVKRSKSYLIKSAILTGPRWLKRRLITSKSGY
ncbi:MAG: glycosyltransferase [Nitrosarchaeum sp.]|nr:glycosyltransferase [Nitrosarchaeum sp.]